MKLKVGDKVRIKKERLLWYLSDSGQDIFFPPSGVQDDWQSHTHDVCTEMILSMLLIPELNCTIEKHNHPHSRESECFTVRVGEATFNVESDQLIYRGGRRV